LLPIGFLFVVSFGEIANIPRVAASKAIISGKEMIDLELLEKIDYKSATERSKLFERK